MNKLEKFFNTLHSTQSKVLKKFTTDELVSQIKEYVDFTPFICKNIYKLLISQNSEDRKNGAAILKSIMFQFRLITDFKIEYTKNKEEYLCSTGEEFVVKQISIREQAKLVKKMAELEHVEVSLVNEIDFKADTSFKIKKQKIKDKPIENIMDFFDNITANLLNYEWNKRHGAFLAFTSMFSESYDGDTEIKVDSSVFMKIYEILKNDKFNDFVDDKTTAPVREAAAELLACIYPRIPKNTIIDELFKFLEDEDWQTQYSGLIALNHLRDFIIKKEDLCLILEKMLIDTDEDVKYLSAQILKHFIKFCNLEEVASKCWDNIRNEEEIAVSKTSIISLLAEIHNINPTIIKIEENINYLFPCFTSPIPEVRKSVLEMVKEIDNESINFLIAETILLDENEEIRELAINILSKINNLGSNFINLFMKILSNSLYEPYSTDDFVSYDELAFTKSGVKLIGEDKILKNRVKLFMAIQKKLIKVEDKSNTAIGKIFYLINEHFYKSNPDDFDLEENNSIKNDNTKVDSTKVDNTKVDKVKRQKIQEDEDFLYKSFSDLRLVPLKELKSKIQNPFKSSIHPMGDPIFRDYLRLKAILDFPVLDLNTSLLFRFETCDEFLRLLSTLIIHKNPTNFIFEAFTLLVEGVDNFKIFFEVLGCRLLFDYSSVLSKINNSNSKIDFYSKTISFYSSEFDQLENLFYESYDKKAIRVLKGFIQNLKYAEKFVDLILKNFDLFLLSELIGDLDHSFYPLFVKKLLKIMHNNDQDVLSPSKILSFIVPRLTFNLNQNLNPIWLNRIEEAKNKLEALLNINKIPEYKSKCPTELILRNYQIEGVKWINFLFSFHLNGILADDMGLGKTIQVLYFICSEIYKTNKKVLILCPSSLTGHWKGEIEKFYPFIKCKIYKKLKNGNEKNGIANGKKDNGKKDNETINGKNQIETTNETTNINHNDSMDQILISSYDMFRNDYLNFIDKNWFYIILDEGHILRNSNTRLYNRVCQLKPTNKLVLTGTPVHNSVEDLISIFNFIMPKYLESSENIQISLKMSDQEVEKTYARLADLNKKILPFILRRLKIDVLKDLPPKIIRDITIEMGPIQQEVYNEINNNNNDNNVFINYKNIKNNAEGLKRTRDLLYASSHTSYFKKSYNEIPCKVKALEDIINLCGGEDIRNKILIFFQYKNTLEFVLEDIKLKFKMKILRLDGSVPSSKRSKIAQDFNEGNIPLLFLTTQIGGLGLNLTGADTVVFYEHDWNPFNDLQAMDRAHRIGQKKTVNVFRLITKGTLEERVMDLQSFKLFVASSLVSQQNADIETMDTKDLLERFS